MRPRPKSLLLFALLLTCAHPGSAWWGDVHTAICEAAYQLTSDQGRSLVDRLGTATDNAPAWPESCSWADDVRYSTHRDTYGYHFVNVPRAEHRTDVSMARDCAAHDCVQQAVKRYAIYLAAPGTREQGRQEALRFLGHFVGDLHQPLHVGYAEDLGGNRIEVAVPGEEDPSYRLHAVWDGIVPRRAGVSGRGAVARIRDRIDAGDSADWATLDFAGAVQDSYDLARLHAYVLPDGRPVETGMTLGEDYFTAAAPIAREQVAKASLRLAHLLDLIARDALDPQQMN